MSDAEKIAACPTPEYHETFYFCPSCPWVAPNRPKDIVETLRDENTSLAAELATLKARVEEAAKILRNDEWPESWREAATRALRALEGSEG